MSLECRIARFAALSVSRIDAKNPSVEELQTVKTEKRVQKDMKVGGLLSGRPQVKAGCACWFFFPPSASNSDAFFIVVK